MILISWFKLHRSVFDHWVSSDAEAFLLWQYMIGMAAYEPTKLIYFGRLIELKPGQILFRGPQLADRLHIDRNKIYRLKALFEQEDMIAVQKIGKRYSIVTVKNYSVYQGDSLPIEKKRETNEKPKQLEKCGLEVLSLHQSEKQTRNKKETIYKKDNKDKNKENIYYPFSEIVSYLNDKAKMSYRSTSKTTQKYITARINEGFTLENFKQVIDNKVADWGHDPKPGQQDMRSYLRPETLFGPKFESYLQSKPATKRVESRNNFQQRDYDDDFYENLNRSTIVKRKNN